MPAHSGRQAVKNMAAYSSSKPKREPGRTEIWIREHWITVLIGVVVLALIGIIVLMTIGAGAGISHTAQQVTGN